MIDKAMETVPPANSLSVHVIPTKPNAQLNNILVFLTSTMTNKGIDRYTEMSIKMLHKM